MTNNNANNLCSNSSNYDEVILKYQSEIADLEKMASEQGNTLNLSMIYITTNCDVSDAQILLQHFDMMGIRIIAEDVEPDNYDSSDGSLDSSVLGEQVNPFNPAQIDIKFSQMIIGAIIKRIQYKELDFDSEFQRKAGLWSNKQKSQLIESIFLNIPLPAFYFDATNQNKWVIIDGLQRLTSIKEFVVDKTLKLSEMEFLSDLNGKTYDQIPRSLQRRIDETDITAYIVNPATPPNVKYNIFKRINTGGLVLEPQEIRNALFQGSSTRYLKKLAQCEAFISATGKSIHSDRMQDREFCLRYVAFTALPLVEYKGNLDDWLNRAMIYLNKQNDADFEHMFSKFCNVMRYSEELFGNHAFRKMASDGRRRPINKAIFEGWSYIIYNLSEKQAADLLGKREELCQSFISLCDSYSFQSNLRGSDRYSVMGRIDQMNSLLFNLIEGYDKNVLPI